MTDPTDDDAEVVLDVVERTTELMLLIHAKVNAEFDGEKGGLVSAGMVLAMLRLVAVLTVVSKASREGTHELLTNELDRAQAEDESLEAPAVKQ